MVVQWNASPSTRGTTSIQGTASWEESVVAKLVLESESLYYFVKAMATDLIYTLLQG
jgi:hypothetical protein